MLSALIHKLWDFQWNEWGKGRLESLVQASMQVIKRNQLYKDY